MKKKNIILLIVFIVGLVSLLIMTSAFKTPQACTYASSNLDFIKTEIEKAVSSKDINIAKYHAYKALNSIEKTRNNFLDCGCDGTIESLEKTLSHLKIATKSDNLRSSKTDLHIALENVLIGEKVLRIFEEETTSSYGTNILVMNTKQALETENSILLTQGNAIEKQVHNCLLSFETSLDKVVTDVDCPDAQRFITNIYEESRLILLNTELSPHKKEYHQRVKELSENALNRLKKCN
ncbi:hypothetical protein [Flagellimonas zhangzhouensis]|uniref:Uncharacterized protein n=1 Tax=Flagellimonas zhangzhouensis TaxID=1073328 RepID=A0A1H2QUF2_9FLAO|nr:hypothetical protein [Allomuricauda zhangzhouensis]SDQ56613.1 hypothetical protein SAMN05216294_1708 [Allomuricauda zhangzhouensis]SDW10500.1 hypothetical protein SAMN04487892_0360 [Allomuricauda zhangzhouensis]